MNKIKVLYFLGIILIFLLVRANRINGSATSGTAPVGDFPPILYDNDITNMRYGWLPAPDHPYVNWYKEGVKYAHFRKTISEVSGLGVNVGYTFSSGHGRVPMWQKTSYSGYSVADHVAWYRSIYGSSAGSHWAQYVISGGDYMQRFLDVARQHRDLRPYIHLRMNDSHYINDLILQDGQKPFHINHLLGVNKFLYDNARNDFEKHFRLESINEVTGPASRSTVAAGGPENYASSEVRDSRMRIIQDLIHNYDPQGLMLNFTRTTGYFRDEVPVSQRKLIMTAFIRDIREELYRSGSDRKLIVKGFTTIAANDQNGLDLPALNSLVDAFIVSSGWATDQVQSYQLAEIRQQMPDVFLYSELFNIWSGGLSGIGLNLATRSQLYEAAGLSYQRGADGISLFNFQYSRPSRPEEQIVGGNPDSGPGREPYFDVIPRLADMQWCKDYRRSLKLDIGASNQTVLTDWTDWSVGAGNKSTVTKTFSSQFDNQFTVKISAGRWFNNSQIIHDMGDAMRDGVVAEGGPLTVTIEGLTAGDYTLTTIHHDPSTNRGNVSIDVQDAGGITKNVVTGLRQSTGSGPTTGPDGRYFEAYSEALFGFRSNGGIVVVTIHGTGGTVLNGLVITPHGSQ